MERRRHLSEDEVNRAIGMLQGGVRQVQVAEVLGVRQSDISQFHQTNILPEKGLQVDVQEPHCLKMIVTCH
jgi:predicted XRE-type DNA-binding protein